MGHLWFETKWSSGALVILLVWSGLVGSGLALVWSCGKTNQSLPVFLMWCVLLALARMSRDVGVDIELKLGGVLTPRSPV
jgi:hypothetical protein